MEAPGWHPEWILKLVPFNEEKQQLYSQPLPDYSPDPYR